MRRRGRVKSSLVAIGGIRVVKCRCGTIASMTDEWVAVDNVNWVHHAMLLKSVLESAGIEVLVPDEHTLAVNPGYGSALGGVRIMVRAADVDKAKEILQSAGTDANADAASAIEAIAEAARTSTRGIIAALVGADDSAVAHVVTAIARASGLEVQRVDIAAVAGKYGGEVEKELNRIFAAAERSRAILLFDEADALFGRDSDRSLDRRTADIVKNWLVEQRKARAVVLLLALRDAEALADPSFVSADYVVSCTSTAAHRPR
jgi:hypothetical protein